MPKPKYPFLYEINGRTWLNRFRNDRELKGLKDVPHAYWSYLKAMGMDCIWIMGVWLTNETEFDRKHLDQSALDNYRKNLPDLETDDIIGSPYAVDDYQINPQLGTTEDLLSLKEKLNGMGMKLILDFVPNHFGRHSRYLFSNPGYFIRGSEEIIKKYPDYFFRLDNEPEKIFAHGRDPYFGPWIDTVQVDYSKSQSRHFLKEQLIKVAALCDGVRCDMAMMLLKPVFYESWHPILPDLDLSDWNEPFWTDSIEAVKSEKPDFLFIAESYWNKEEILHKQGFDFCYDKVLTDKLKFGNHFELKTHISGRMHFHEKTVHFLENHDEKRALEELGVQKNQAAAALACAMPGMRLFHEGQWEGKRVHSSIHLSRSYAEDLCPCHLQEILRFDEKFTYHSIDKKLMFRSSDDESGYPGHRFPIEAVCKCTYSFYNQLLKVMNQPAFKSGECRFVEFVGGPEGQEKVDGVFGFEWEFEGELSIVLVNYSNQSCKVSIPLLKNQAQKMHVIDTLNNAQLTSRRDFQKGLLEVYMVPLGVRVLSFHTEIEKGRVTPP